MNAAALLAGMATKSHWGGHQPSLPGSYVFIMEFKQNVTAWHSAEFMSFRKARQRPLAAR
jgi:hypothetical protein